MHLKDGFRQTGRLHRGPVFRSQVLLPHQAEEYFPGPSRRQDGHSLLFCRFILPAAREPDPFCKAVPNQNFLHTDPGFYNPPGAGDRLRQGLYNPPGTARNPAETGLRQAIRPLKGNFLVIKGRSVLQRQADPQVFRGLHAPLRQYARKGRTQLLIPEECL